MATTYYTDIQKLYVAYFNRPADVAGLAYWETVVEANKGSTALVSAAFAASAEYKANYAGQTNEQIVNTVYTNLFSHAADAPGQAYWANLLNNKQITIDNVVSQIAAGALTTDLTAYNNKVTAAAAFTAALDLPAEQAGYANPLAIPAARTFLSGVTDNASLAAAIAPATLNASVAAVVAAGTPFTLTNALANLQTANDAKAAFLDVAIDGKVGGTISTETDISANVTAKVAALDALVAGDYTNSTSNVKSALLADQMSANATLLATDQATVAADNAAIAKIAGLSAAMNAEASTKAGVTAANTALVSAATDLAVKLSAYNIVNGATVTVAANGTVAGVITLDSSNHLVLATGVTEATKPGVTALLAASIANESAEVTVTAATSAEAAALAQFNYLDQSALEVTDLAGLKTMIGTDITIAAGAQPTLADITTETSILTNRATTADAIAAAPGATPAQVTAAATAHTTLNNFTSAVATYMTDAAVNPNAAKLTADSALVTADNATVKSLATAVADLNTANAIATQLASVNGSVAAATKVFADHSLSIPVNAAGTLVASAGSDIYVAGTTDATIALFGLQGNDSLYIGSKYAFGGTDITKGNDSVLEVFFVANATGGTDVKLETKVFGSNSSDAEITITLTGVSVDHVHLANGIITVS